MNCHPRQIRTITLLMLLAFCLIITSALAAGTGSSPALQQTVTASEPVLDEILQVSNKYFSTFPFMRAEDVYEKIVKGGDSSYLLVSVQSADDYARGHIPGAINIPFQEIAEAASLARLPRDKKIVLSCEDGHRSMAAALFLGQLGYDTKVVSMGLSYWNKTGAQIASPYPGSAGYPVSTADSIQKERYELPTMGNIGKDVRGVIIERTKAVIAQKPGLFINRNEVYENAVKGTDKKYFLVSLQRPEDYSKGHVPGAINIPYSEIAKADSLSKLPRNKKIVLICYVGHWAGSAALFLNQLGYEAYDMRFGTLGWNDATDGLGEAKGYLVALGGSLSLPVERRDLKK
ncbi:thiosulfate sulfurtransferase GlpE [Geobacter sp. OR-1]|uniref:rhodanese-like domain-containing protein n=1 Tax=Geobacter sp. OR-1 TaxID=1266765 RepID=UPI000543F5DC|nr:rhodanese-like domain-containing protein [Geobacter sp. OR-1]GAM10406.1 thiosulfate sulfurtransferase GlpE [Geobacter sp. OR-1]